MYETFNIINNANRLSLEKLSNPFPMETREERLKKSGAINLQDNHRIIDWDNGYNSIEPIDRTKTF